jgi:hypothetical protein
MTRRSIVAALSVFLLAFSLPTITAGQGAPRDRAAWIALAKGGFAVPDGDAAFDLLQDMNPLLGSTDPVLRDDVAYTAAERWILRERKIRPAAQDMLLIMWGKNLEEGIGTADDRVFKRSFSALCISVVAAAELSVTWMSPDQVERLFSDMLSYFARERDLRGFDPTHGWMHTVAHTSDALKFLARNPKLGKGVDTRLMSAVRAKIESAETVFQWGENDRMALALQSAVRRADADPTALEVWAQAWADAHRALWATGPQVDPRRFAQIENAKQVMRSLHAALAMEAAPTPTGEAARKVLLAALAKMR